LGLLLSDAWDSDLYTPNLRPDFLGIPEDRRSR